MLLWYFLLSIFVRVFRTPPDVFLFNCDDIILFSYFIPFLIICILLDTFNFIYIHSIRICKISVFTLSLVNTKISHNIIHTFLNNTFFFGESCDQQIINERYFLTIHLTMNTVCWLSLVSFCKLNKSLAW